MTKKQLLVVLITFIIGFGGTFYVIRTFFPRHKTEKASAAKGTVTDHKDENKK